VLLLEESTMKRLGRLLTVLLVLSVSVGFIPAQAQKSPIITTFQPPNRLIDKPYAADRVLVQMRTQSSAFPYQGGVASVDPSLQVTLNRAGVTTAKPLFSLNLAAELDTFGMNRMYELQLSPGSDVLAAVALLANDPSIEYAEPDYLAYAAAIPDDPYYDQQWGLGVIDAPAA
jgi:hypothetical protein